MKAHVVPRPAGELTGSITMQAIQALDLTGHPEHRALWRSRGAAAAGALSAAGLPNGGHASPMGFWLASTTDAGSLPPDSLRLTLRTPGEAAPDQSSLPPSRRGERASQTVRVKGLTSADGDLILTVGPRGAQVIASEAAWQSLAEPVLLAVCQYWRFCAVDTEIDRLTELAHGDIGHATMPSPASLRASRRLSKNAQDVRALMVDLPHFEGPLTDAFPYCTSERSAQVYESLAEKLDLEDWCDAIDERAEAIEDTYEAVTEKLFEYRNFAWEAILEGLIIIILLGELAILWWETFGP
ncbi:MAG TPA: hypothetical protein VGZ22_26505 [Isosphaeraceae bacterium]|jgi:hypothetical protein|nr:hypothetical protein [Isosphaeraceae bacterium]